MSAESDPKRKVPTSFRDWIRADSDAEFPAEVGRYHLYIGLGCPFASRTNFMLAVKGLNGVISKSIAHFEKGDLGWEFTPGHYRTDADTVNGKKYIREIYEMSAPGYAGTYSVPVLFDKQTKQIVNNESGDIIRILNCEFNAFCETDAQRAVDLCPDDLLATREQWNASIGTAINSGVYRVGFAKTQEDYDTHVKVLFDALDELEGHLATNRYVCGNRLTETDVRLFMSLARFDYAYHGIYKCNKRRLADYPHLWAFAREIYQLPGVEETVDRFHILHFYYGSRQVNPNGVVAIGPDVDFMQPHGREVIGN